MICRAFFLAIAAIVCVQVVPASTVVFYNQAQWQAAMTANGTNPLTDVSFDSADWTSSFQASRSFNSLTSQSTTAASNGMAISVVAGYSPLGVANNSLLGQVGNGVWSDTISKYGTTTFNFADPIYGFGGDFNIAGSNGLEIFPGATPFATPNGVYDGFVGVVSDGPLSSIMITWGQNGNCYGCFGNSYTLSDFQLANQSAANPEPVNTPEPNFKYAFAGLLLLTISFAIWKRQ